MIQVRVWWVFRTIQPYLLWAFQKLRSKNPAIFKTWLRWFFQKLHVVTPYIKYMPAWVLQSLHSVLPSFTTWIVWLLRDLDILPPSSIRLIEWVLQNLCLPAPYVTAWLDWALQKLYLMYPASASFLGYVYHKAQIPSAFTTAWLEDWDIDNPNLHFMDLFSTTLGWVCPKSLNISNIFSTACMLLGPSHAGLFTPLPPQ
jgi:hypothetical protein